MPLGRNPFACGSLSLTASRARGLGFMEENKHMDFRHRSVDSDDYFDSEDLDDAFLSGKQRRDKEAAKAAQKEWLDEKLDIALEESFPGSDPISIAQPPQSPYEKLKP